MYFCYFIIIFSWKRSWPFILNKIESPLPKDTFCRASLKLAQWFWRRIFLSFVKICLIFRNYLPLEKSVALHLNEIESPSPKDVLCQVWLILAPWFWRRKLSNSVNLFFANSYLRVWYIWINMNPFHQTMLCAKSGWNWPSDSGEENFVRFCKINFNIS